MQLIDVIKMFVQVLHRLCYLLAVTATALCQDRRIPSLDVPSTPVPAGHSLHHALHHFEVLHKHHLEHRYISHSRRTLTFSTLDRKFSLRLSSRAGLFSEGLEVNSVGANGVVNRHRVDVGEFFTGEVQGEKGSMVTVHLNQKEGVLTASIRTKSEHYFVEPSHRHFKQSHDFHMITYRASDLKYNFTRAPATSFCGAGSQHSSLHSTSSLDPPPLRPSSLTRSIFSSHKPSRLRRQTTPTRNSCPMLLVATGRFHQAYSSNLNVENTILFMVQVIDDVDQNIFRPVRWDEDIQNFGLTVMNITVYEEPNIGPEYNMERSWESGAMLRLFSHNDWSKYCLAHLFAFEGFTDGLLGVAYPASADGFPGGICTVAEDNFNGGVIATANVGLSSYRGDGGRVLLLAEARLITAHEIGHNWGSEHDPTRPIGVCNPVLSSDAGKFLMFPAVSDGLQANNDQFSNCSRGLVSEVLRAKSADCFVVPNTQCGNYAIDGEDEDCDAGLQGTLGLDSCCDDRCHLKDVADCSDSNHACCTDCSYSNSSRICRSFPEDNSLCYANITCSGESKSCPMEIRRVAVNTTCRGKGRCLNNGTVCLNGICEEPTPSPFNRVECYDFCRLRGMEKCLCPDSDEDTGNNVAGVECHFCCRNLTLADAPCELFPETLPDGTSCMGGLCDEGVCVPHTQDLVNRLYSLFTDISIDKFIQFLAENIVGSVVFISAVIWLIVGSCIHCYDLRTFRMYRDTIAELEEDELLQSTENQLDNAYLDDIASNTPSLDSTHMIRRGLSRMGSRVEFPSLGSTQGFGRQYSVKSGYVRVPSNRFVHGHRLSSVLERSKEMDPSTSNIMEHILDNQSEAFSPAETPQKRVTTV